MEEKKIIKKFMGEVFSNKGLGIYGVKEVTSAVQSGIADIVIVADNVTYLVLESKCKKCEHLDQTVIDRSSAVTTRQQNMAKPCPICGSTDYDISEKDIVEHLEELTAVTGTRLEVISAQTEEGNQLTSLGGIGAILRFKPVSNS